VCGCFRHLKTDSDSEVLLNIFADEIHRAHQRFVQVRTCSSAPACRMQRAGHCNSLGMALRQIACSACAAVANAECVVGGREQSAQLSA
jgi:hypothetical protein